MAAFKLTLVENDTGEVLVNEHIDCLIGAACTEGGNRTKMLYAQCNGAALDTAKAGVLEIVERLETNKPEIKKSRKRRRNQ